MGADATSYPREEEGGVRGDARSTEEVVDKVEIDVWIIKEGGGGGRALANILDTAPDKQETGGAILRKSRLIMVRFQ